MPAIRMRCPNNAGRFKEVIRRIIDAHSRIRRRTVNVKESPLPIAAGAGLSRSAVHFFLIRKMRSV